MNGVARRWLRLAIRAYPRDFRDIFAADLEETMAVRIARARSRSVWHGAAMTVF